jgi:peptide/nickel transport system substrate-binding protein
MRAPHRRRAFAAACAVVAGTMFAAAPVASAGERTSAPAGKSGGSVTYALDAETTGGWCLPQAQLAPAGHQVRVSIYDSLTVINSEGKYVPYLAKSVTASDDRTEWTITLRDGVKFHDGTPLTADAVKLNLDALRGQNPALPARLFVFVFANIDSVTVADPLTVVVKTKVPWTAFPSYLSTQGISAPAQLNDPSTCPRNMIGTGPFKLKEWRPNESLTVVKNPDYWRKGFPKLDQITFVPVPESQSRNNGLQSGDYDLIMTSNSLSISDLQDKAAAGDIKALVSDKGAETAYQMLNVSKAPFDDKLARQAVAYAGDSNEVNQIRNKGLNTIANGPFPPDNPVFLPELTFQHNLKKAKALAKEYEQKHGQPISFEYLSVPDPDNVAIAQLVKEQQAKAGIEVSIRTLDQSALINEVLAGGYQSAGFRNHAGGDPDTQYVWWHSGSPVNFGRINDAVIDKDLDEARSELDPAKRVELYKDLNRRFHSELYTLWAWYTLWAVGYQDDVGGVKGPPLPDGGGKPFPLFAGVIPTVGITKR